MWDPTLKVLKLQVGLGSGGKPGGKTVLGDHDIWRLPEADDALNANPGDPNYFVEYRPVFVNQDAAPAAQISPNLAGRVAAAFALCYQVLLRSLCSLPFSIQPSFWFDMALPSRYSPAPTPASPRNACSTLRTSMHSPK